MRDSLPADRHRIDTCHCRQRLARYAVNDIEFLHRPGREEPHTPVVSIRIDGVDLRDLVAEAVTPLWALELDDDDFDSADERNRFIAEGHDGLPVEDVGWPQRHFLGEIAPYYGGYEADDVPLLGCTCGLWGCWPLLARIDVGPRTVTWSSFRQPCRPQWGVLPLGPFTFDRVTYLERLAVSR